MYIKSIDIQNFRRFEHFKCEFDPRLTLVIGVNGEGKTSLLKAVTLGLSALLSRAGLETEFSRSDVRKVNAIDPSDEAWRTPVFPARIALQCISPEGETGLAIERTRESQSLSASYGQYFSGSKEGWNIVGELVSRWFNGSNSGVIPLIARFGASNSWVGAARPNSIEKPFETKQEIWGRALVDSIDVTALAQWFQYNEIRSLQEKRQPLIYRLARNAVLSSIEAEDINYVARDNQLMVKHKDVGWRPFDELSDGQRRLASIFCELAIRCASLNSHLGEDCIRETTGIVTIDELDLHLHPRWQRDIIGNLLRVFPKLQFIVASHSPFLLQSAFEFGKVLDVGTGQFVEVGDASIEDIAETVMGVDHPQRSSRFNEMKAKAQAFYELLEKPATTPEEIAKLKAELDVAQAPFANDPASAAWLEQRRAAAGH